MQMSEVDELYVVFDDEGDAMTPALNATLLRDLHQYALGRQRDGEGAALLAQWQCHQPALIRSLQIGYVPATYRDALSKDDLDALGALDLSDCLLLPAVDAQGHVVDACLLHADGSIQTSVHDEPRGRIDTLGRAPAPAELVIYTDNLHAFLALHAAGYQAAWLRSVDDLKHYHEQQQNAWALTGPAAAYKSAADALQMSFSDTTFSVDDNGRIKRHGAAQANLRLVDDDNDAASADNDAVAATIDTDLELIDAETDTHRIAYRCGSTKYLIELRDDGLSNRQVIARACNGDGFHKDHFDLSVEKQCRRFATVAARPLGREKADLTGELTQLWQHVQQYERERFARPRVAVNTSDQAAAEAWLNAPDLLQSIVNDLSEMGWVGEDAAKGLCYLTAVSRLLSKPLWAVYQGSEAAAPWQQMALLAELIPDEAKLPIQELTPALIAQSDPALLRHRLLLIDHADLISKRAALSLRVLHERGGLSLTEQGEAAGGPRELRGPVAAIATAHAPLDKHCQHCFVTIPVDESQAQTARIVAAQQSEHAFRLDAGDTWTVRIARHHALQRVLQPLQVQIPYAHRIQFPARSVRHRQEHAFLLQVIKASALLHQLQRARHAQRPHTIIADELDFHHAVKLAGSLLGTAGDGLRDKSRTLLRVLTQEYSGVFTQKDLARYFTDWTRYSLRTALSELLELDYIEIVKQGRGRGSQMEYALVAETTAQLQHPQQHICLGPETIQSEGRNGFRTVNSG